jgi:hypothetical protein
MDFSLHTLCLEESNYVSMCIEMKMLAISLFQGFKIDLPGRE